jgi:AcrR family transcriptional regulator
MVTDENEKRRGGRARQRLLAAAGELFYQRGIRAVGVDEVVRQAGVAKVSLYRAFPSKDDLIVAYLEERDAEFWNLWDRVVDGAPDAAAALNGVVALLADAIERPDYRGCPFANFTSEFPEREHAGRLVVERSKRELKSRLSALTAQRSGTDPEGLADALLLLTEGAFSLSQTAQHGRELASRSLRRGACTLLTAY